MSNTTLTIYKGSNKALQLTILKVSNSSIYEPTAAFAAVIDRMSRIVIAEVECLVDSNKASFILNTTTLSRGNYAIRWKIVKVVGINTYISYHRTELKVLEFY